MQVDRQSNPGREGGKSRAKRAVQLSLWVEDRGGVSTHRVMGNDPVNS